MGKTNTAKFDVICEDYNASIARFITLIVLYLYFKL